MGVVRFRARYLQRSHSVSSLRRHISLAIFTAAAAGLTWAVATGTVENYPAKLSFTYSLPGETLVSVNALAYPSAGGNPASVSANAPLTAPVELIVNGGDPNNAADLGIDYQPWTYAYFANPSASSSYLRLIKNNATRVDNTTANPSVTVPVAFSYPAIRRANVSLNVVGASTIASYYFTASAYSSTVGEQYYAQTYGTTNQESSITTWVPMVPTNNVTLYGTIYLRNPDGSQTQRNLTGQLRDLTSGDASASWTIDLTSLAHVEGDIAILALPPGAAPTSYQVRYRGASGPTSGISGTLYVTTAAPHYAVDLPPGDYDFSLVTNFSSPSSSSETASSRVTLAAGSNPNKNFYESFGKARVDVNVGGFYTTAGLNALTTVLKIPSDGTKRASSGQRAGNGVEQVVPFGPWQSEYTYLTVYDGSDSLAPLNNQLYRYHYTDADLPAVLIDSTATRVVATEAPTLVRTNVYFDVIEPTGTVAVRNPQLTATRYDYNPDNSLRGYKAIYAYGSGTDQLVSRVPVVGEPGTYNITATGYVNNQQTTFGRAGATITFGAPVFTPPSPPPAPGQPAPPPVEVVLADQDSGSHLNLSLSFSNVTGEGLTTVVENPLGPAPPEGFQLSCSEPVTDENGQPACEPLYYDITTTAAWTGSTKVCIRRRSALPNGIAESLLKLYHYDAPTWEELPPPADGSPAFFDCSADLATCGCSSEQDCGIEYGDDYTLNAYLICGETTSFSPFAIMQGRYTFTNKVGGVLYEGPQGPPSGLQRFVAPSSGTYRITANGARGAKATAASASVSGGCGAEVSGEVVLQDGDALDILVGQMGTAATNSGGGGGGSFVVKNGVPLFVAGGGGGVRSGATVSGRGGVLTLDGGAGSTSASYASGFVAGGVGGAGGARVVSYGAGGGGWSGNGASDGNYGDGGAAFTGPNQGKGGLGKTCSGGLAHGGYGGGGAGNGCYGGGGGGGYSGGGGGRVGGGGGSLNTGTNQRNLEGSAPAACTQTGHGQVVIEFVTP